MLATQRQCTGYSKALIMHLSSEISMWETLIALDGIFSFQPASGQVFGLPSLIAYGKKKDDSIIAFS